MSTPSSRHNPIQSPAIDLTDNALFGNDAGEDEDPDVLAAYFVESENFRLFHDQRAKLQVARARKGMGKSTLLSKFAYDLTNRYKYKIVIQATGADFIGFENIPPHDFSAHIHKWRELICSRISAELAKQIGFASNDTEVTMVESAEIDGYKGRNLLGCLLARVGGRLPSVNGNLTSTPTLIVTPQKARDNFQLLKRYCDQEPDAVVWLLIDDIDSTFINSEESRSRVSTFFSACRNLVREIKGIHIRSSVRTDVWTVIAKNEDLDKFEQYITDIIWSGEEFRRILLKRILAYALRKNPARVDLKQLDVDKDADFISSMVFVPYLQWGTKRVRPFNPIKILAAGRPRWMSQLCRLAGAAAKRHHHLVIGIQDINASMEKYGSYRLSDLYKEHAHQFSHLQKLIEVFSGGVSMYSTETLLSLITRKYILPIGAAGVPPLEGEPYTNPLQFAHFLYKIGFIAGRPDTETYLFFEDHPALLRRDLSVDPSINWEIQPSYRQALRIRREQANRPRLPRLPSSIERSTARHPRSG